MIDAYTIGITLALNNGVADGIAAIRRDLAALDRAVDASAAGLAQLRAAATGSFAAASADLARLKNRLVAPPLRCQSRTRGAHCSIAATVARKEARTSAADPSAPAIACSRCSGRTATSRRDVNRAPCASFPDCAEAERCGSKGGAPRPVRQPNSRQGREASCSACSSGVPPGQSASADGASQRSAATLARSRSGCFAPA